MTLGDETGEPAPMHHNNGPHTSQAMYGKIR
jgi:hypothetical protein